MQLESAIDHLGKLIAFKTVSSASNLALLDWVEQICAPYGARFRRFPNEAGDKANLLVSIGPDVPGGLVLSGHTDVVPTEAQHWLADPFVMRRENGHLIGRGSTDMKGFLACCLAILPQLQQLNLQRPLHLAFSYDEEVGCTGVGSMAQWLGQTNIRPDFAIIGEPSRMKAISAHKGGLIGWAHVRGKAGHSSQPDRYVNAIMTGARLIAFIEDLRGEMRAGPKFDLLDPPYSTIQVNQIGGGTAGNIVAENCSFFWEMRVIPGEDPYEVLRRIRDYARNILEPAMQAVDPDSGIDIEEQAHIPALRPNQANATQAALLDLLGQQQMLAVPYGSEAGIFQDAGIAAFICGPGDIAQAHQPEEFIAEAQLAHCLAFLTKALAVIEEPQRKQA